MECIGDLYDDFNLVYFYKKTLKNTESLELCMSNFNSIFNAFRIFVSFHSIQFLLISAKNAVAT